MFRRQKRCESGAKNIFRQGVAGQGPRGISVRGCQRALTSCVGRLLLGDDNVPAPEPLTFTKCSGARN